MIRQSHTGLNSRSEANPFNKDGFLPIITAPMYSVTDENNYKYFLKNKIQVCLPRRTSIDFEQAIEDKVWLSYSIGEFDMLFINNSNDSIKQRLKDNKIYICIDTANGNIPILHEKIIKAKEIHGDSLVLMAGNVASIEAFLKLASTGVDYIRVGIGGGAGCNTTSNTGVGQQNLEKLITDCKYHQRFHPKMGSRFDFDNTQIDNIRKVKIVADGISSYINHCQKEYGFNDNGYAAINKLLFTGADLVMVGKLFAQCLESAGDKTSKIRRNSGENWIASGKAIFEIWNNERDELMVKYSGMSTQQEQLNYKPLSNGNTGFVQLKPSEGSVNWIPVRWTLNEWLNGSVNQDEYPYLMGWTNSIKSAMSYAGKVNFE